VPTLTQCLRDGCATATGLTRAVRVDVHQLPTSFCRFVGQWSDERRPSGIVDGLGEHAAGQPLDVHILDSDHAIGVDQGVGDLVLKVRSLVLDLGVSLWEQEHGFSAILSPALSASHTALCTSQGCLAPLVAARVVDLCAIGEHRTGRQAHIQAHAGIGLRQRSCLALDTETDIPFAILALIGKYLSSLRKLDHIIAPKEGFEAQL
jgi:hypothetical protein